MSREKFAFGFFMGVLAGVAAKILYDNREEVYVVIGDKAKEASENINDFVGYAQDRVQEVSESVAKKANDYIGLAKEQINEIKANLKGEAEKAEDTPDTEGEHGEDKPAE
ncbi:MAG: hypothetical protein LBC69_00745 [Eubacteriaceae bacterium]|jgi:F0F1-type ATP synthase membrane subunit b/b'|nr:hypothetical protein [Eubacteriaceae bacterium]